MLLSLAYIFLGGLLLRYLFTKIHLPALLGMLITGILLGPYTFNLIDEKVFDISPELRQIALVIILLRAGLALDFHELRKVGRSAVLLSFLPACCEIIGAILLAPPLLGISTIEAALLGTVIAAVSPAVLVPKMLMLMNKNIGTRKAVPQMLMAAGSVDDVYVIVLFSALTAIMTGQDFSAVSFLAIPCSIATGIISGLIIGRLTALFFVHIHTRDSIKVMIIMGISFILISLEKIMPFPFSGLLAVMMIGIMILCDNKERAKRLSAKFSKLWITAEILLFVLVGAAVNLPYAAAAGIVTIALVLGAICFRMIGVNLSLIKSPLTTRERLFCMIAYSPKATVQAAIGTIPLALGLPCGEIILTVAVLSILITAPLGALGIEFSYKRLLT